MSIHAALNHVTHYKYDRPVQLGPQVVRLRPAPHCRSNVISYSLQGRAGEAFRQLAAGSVRQLPGAPGVPRQDHRVQGHGRPRGGDGGLQPVRLLPRAGTPRTSRSSTNRWRRRSSRPTSRSSPSAAASNLSRARSIASRSAPSISWSASTRSCSSDIKYLIRMEPGVQTPGRDADERQRFLPRLRLAAGAAAAPLRPGGALRLRLSHPAHARREGARRPQRHQRRLHRPARLVRGVPAGRRLDRARPDLGPAGRRRPHPAGLHAAAFGRRADRGRGGRRRRSSSAITCRSRASTNRRA